MKKLDLSGQKFGRLTAIRDDGKTTNGGTKWLCVCECGEKTSVFIGHLRNGETTSCGCFKRESTAKRSKKHGDASGGNVTVEYDAWRGMWDRCTNPNYEGFHNYGGRGIVVCERWKKYENFLTDMGRRPSNKHSLDRYPNVNGNYEPNNCRWATAKQQAGNRTTNKWLSWKGRKMIQADWAREMGVDVRRLHALLARNSFKSIMTHYEKHGVIDRRKSPFNKDFYKKPARAMLGRVGSLHHASKPVIQLNKKTGEELREYASIRQACIQTGISNIDKALRDNSKSAGGFKWKYS